MSRLLDSEISPDQYLEWKRRAIDVVRTSLPSGAAFGEKEVRGEIDGMMERAVVEGWLKGEWYGNIQVGSVGVEGEEMEGVEMTGEERRDRDGQVPRNGGGLKRLFEGVSEDVGLATMRQDAVDYLNEERKREYRRWREGVLRVCAQVEGSA